MIFTVIINCTEKSDEVLSAIRVSALSEAAVKERIEEAYFTQGLHVSHVERGKRLRWALKGSLTMNVLITNLVL